MKTILRQTLFAIAIVCLIAGPAAAEVASVIHTPTGLAFTPNVGHEGMTLTMTGPNGINHSASFGPADQAQLSIFDKAGNTYPDGTYSWQLSVAPQLDDSLRAQLEAVAGDGPAVAELRQAAGLGNADDYILSGAFTINEGAIASRDVVEPAPAANEGGIATKAQTFATDLIVQGSTCIGVDCTTSESFGFDTLRFKENNLRVKFQDTSASASFPGNDWEIEINSSDNGGAEYFAIDDVTGNKTPFRILAGAPTNSLYVNASGDIGIGTASPVVETHIADGDSPTLRLEQNGSSGFQSQTWDIAGNETNFFVRDVTNGSKLPFKIIPNAPTNALYVAASGNIGIGNASPSSPVHVKRSDDTAQVFVEDTGSTAQDLLLLKNAGPSRFALENTIAGDVWRFNYASDGNLRISDSDGDVEMELDTAGNLTTFGTVNGSSDRNKKKDFEAVNTQAVLDAIANLPITEWSYKADAEAIRHIGPMAQDFFAAFGLGVDERHIALTDMSGVALAAIQALNDRVEEKEQENAELKDRLARLEAAIDQLAGE